MSSKELILTLVREQDFVIETTDEDVFITGTCFSLPPFQTNIWASKNLTIRAYDLSLSEDLFLPGKTLKIITRFLRATGEITLSVSGNAGTTQPISANNGRQPGAHGSNGLAGSDGDDAGEILVIAESLQLNKLILKANGGSGGNGQDGGNGAPGYNGANAPDRHLENSDKGPGHTGGNGGSGGNAGAGGSGGNGGNGGNITVICSDPTSSTKIETEYHSGEKGFGGKHGDFGSGGRKGLGGQGVDCLHYMGGGHGDH